MLTLPEIQKRLTYDPETGLFWHVPGKCSRMPNGGPAGSPDKDGYLRIHLDGRKYSAHRLAWMWAHGCWPKHQIDHINGVKSDNRISNLRDVPQSENLHNIYSPSSRNRSTGMRGVARLRGMFTAAISINNRQVVLGRFHTAEAAHAAYMEAKSRVITALAEGKTPTANSTTEGQP